MDIKNLSESLATNPTFPQARDLLAQLKAAGSVEAEVVKVLQDKLLLSTRLGDFLTSNTLNYKRGDQLELRLGGSEQKPVLKSRPVTPKPVTLDSARNPRLQRALAPNQATLAVVTRVAAQRMEIRLAEQILTLPRQTGVGRHQLLSLQRNDSNRSVEIIPLERKQVYKALLKHLVPRQTESGPSKLVKLLNLVNQAIAKPPARPPLASNLPRPTVNAKSGDSQPATQAGPALQAAAKTTSIVQPLPATKPDPGPAAPTRLAPTQAPSTSSPTGATRRSVETASPESNHQISSLLQQIKRVAHNSNGLTGSLKAAAMPTQPVETTNPRQAAEPIRPGLPVIREPVTKANLEAVVSNKPAATILPASSLSIESRATVPSAQHSGNLATAAERARPGENQVSAAETPTTLQRLLQQVPRLNQLSAAQIRQWLEFANLVRQTPAKSTSTQINPLHLLKQLASQDILSREIIQSIQPKADPGIGNEAPPAKSLPQELLQQYAREGIKLIEQAVSQNLLQRASLGMQQETQQPLSLGFALPFLDEHQVKPLQIDLAQREQVREDGEGSWDLRVSFEFAGLGPVAVHIFLEGFTVAASFYAEQAVTRNRIEHALPELRRQLSNAGFTTGELHSFSGVSGHKPDRNTGLSESLIDIEV